MHIFRTPPSRHFSRTSTSVAEIHSHITSHATYTHSTHSAMDTHDIRSAHVCGTHFADTSPLRLFCSVTFGEISWLPIGGIVSMTSLSERRRLSAHFGSCGERIEHWPPVERVDFIFQTAKDHFSSRRIRTPQGMRTKVYIVDFDFMNKNVK